VNKEKKVVDVNTLAIFLGEDHLGEPALKEDATTIITTDTGFKRLCKRVNLNYINPVPIDVLKRFREWDQNL